MNLNPAEAIMAITGLGSALGETDVPRITVGVMLDAARMPKALEKAAAEMIRGEARKHKIRARKHSWKRLHGELSQPLPAHVLESVLHAFPHNQMDLAGIYQTLLQNVHAYLKAIFPVQEMQSFTGPKFSEPDDLSTFMFYNQLNLLEDPMAIFTLIGNGALLRDQVKPFKEVYPTLSEAIDNAIWAALAQEALVSRRLSMIVEQGLGVWLDRRTVAYDPEHGQPAPEPPQKVQPKPRDNLMTPQQKSNNPGAT